MRCPSFHLDNRSDRRFCTQCGTKLAVGCPSCGAPIEVGEKFCGACGAALTIGGRPATPPPAHAPLFAEKIRQVKATVEGERKQVTVLFADVKGSIKLAEQLDPEAWSQITRSRRPSSSRAPTPSSALAEAASSRYEFGASWTP